MVLRPSRQKSLDELGRARRSYAPTGPPVGWHAFTPEQLLGPLSELERKYAPARLYAAGPMRVPLPSPRVSIVGTRKPSIEGRETASKIASSLSKWGVVIVSGLAEGIDTAAHTAAIDSGGQTIAVLGTPLSRTYPWKNLALQRLIMRRHLALSQFPEGSPVQPKNFVIRNRTMALLSDASVIIESGDRGGSLHQGWEAIRLGRPLFIHAHEFAKPGLEWPRRMASYGALKFEEPSEIAELIPSANPDLAIVAFESA